MDAKGVMPSMLENAQVLHISPSHHFPTGLVTPRERRMELLGWAYQQADRYIIEDDYDSEFRFSAHPMPTMQSMDAQGRVIYMNTFSKTLAPSIRISYMVLPPELMERFQRELGFYSCTVPSFEQYTLTRFLGEGHFEKHLNRMRKAYKFRRNAVAEALMNSPYASQMTLLEQDAGLHFLLRVTNPGSEEDLVDRCAKAGIRVRTLGSYMLSGVRNKPDGLGDWKRNRRNGTWSPYANNPERAVFDAIRFDRSQVPGLSSHYDASTRDGFVWMTPTPFIHDGAAWLGLSQMPTSGDFGPQWVEVKGSEVMAALGARREDDR
jgi:hypothetical protein